VSLTDDGRWLSYSELAGERGISRQSAVRLVRRQRWRRQMGNDGEARVFVPGEHLPGVTPPDNGLGHDTGDDTGHQTLMASALAALETAVLSLTERASVAERRADEVGARAERAVADRDALRQQLLRADARSDELRTERDQAQERADGLQAGQELMMDMHARALAAVQGDLEMARAQATTAHDALKAVRQAQAERKGRGLLARLRAAVRGT